MTDDPAAPACSWTAEFFTHFKYDPAGKWLSTDCRFPSADQAQQAALKTLTRVLRSDPGSYVNPDPAVHCRASRSMEPPNLTIEIPSNIVLDDA